MYVKMIINCGAHADEIFLVSAVCTVQVGTTTHAYGKCVQTI